MSKSTNKKMGTPALEIVGSGVPITIDVDETRYVRIGWIVVLVGVVGFLLWATFAPLSKGVTVQGTVVVTGNRKTIQHPTGGIVQDILVHEGDTVKAGQVLVRMNDVQAKADVSSIRARYLSDLAVKSRLLAEASNADQITLPSELTDRIAAHDRQVEDDVALQKQLLISRRLGLQAALGALNEQIAGYGAQLAGSKGSAAQLTLERQTLDDQLGSMRELANEGYAPRVKVQELERQSASLNGEILRGSGTIGQLSSQIAEARMHAAQLKDDYLKDVRTQLTEVQRDAEDLRSRLQASEFQLANSDVRSPVDGTVVGVNVFTDGGVVGAGAKLMDVVPTGEPLEVEGELPVNLVDKVKDGMRVEMMFTAFNSNTTPRVPGVLTLVSADRLVNERTGAPYYRVRAKVTPHGMAMLGKLDIRAGMPVELFVNAGQRSMMSYLMKPIVDRANTAMTED
ncbi:HlyD family type I secretion periplasmic adaptor subunit [Burkholderia guangdongensis]|uniref:HlyD family type I secretion periplasmic adaptor subunit n=1 Tax=Burkholderia guangdongensis TaxID=1792500 RepID=UPI0015CEF034|nr:HlyD family type I secretion periplasmic adaptor subunit [Burkholderia guangdongensis]